jgi:hypothetical protein
MAIILIPLFVLACVALSAWLATAWYEELWSGWDDE